MKDKYKYIWKTNSSIKNLCGFSLDIKVLLEIKKTIFSEKLKPSLWERKLVEQKKERKNLLNQFGWAEVNSRCGIDWTAAFLSPSTLYISVHDAVLLQWVQALIWRIQ